MLTLTLADVVESYRGYLELHQATHPKQFALKRFDQRLSSTREAAQTEAVAFQFLRSRNLEPCLHEDASVGGSDFECTFGQTRFVVEATALTDDTVSKRSGIQNDLNGGPGYVNMPSTVAALRSRLSKKAGQGGRYGGPRVLSIGSTHIAGSMLFGVAIEELLTGQSAIVVPIGPEGATGESYMATELKNAAHVRHSEGGEIELFRKTYALVLFLAVHGGGVHVTGLIHPEPEYELPFSIFPRVPFARLVWPIADNTLNVEWVVAHPRPDQHVFSPIEPTDKELREGIP